MSGGDEGSAVLEEAEDKQQVVMPSEDETSEGDEGGPVATAPEKVLSFYDESLLGFDERGNEPSAVPEEEDNNNKVVLPSEDKDETSGGDEGGPVILPPEEVSSIADNEVISEQKDDEKASSSTDGDPPIRPPPAVVQEMGLRTMSVNLGLSICF